MKDDQLNSICTNSSSTSNLGIPADRMLQDCHKKVLLPKRKRHTSRRVSRNHLLFLPGEGVPHTAPRGWGTLSSPMGGGGAPPYSLGLEGVCHPILAEGYASNPTGGYPILNLARVNPPPPIWDWMVIPCSLPIRLD